MIETGNQTMKRRPGLTIGDLTGPPQSGAATRTRDDEAGRGDASPGRADGGRARGGAPAAGRNGRGEDVSAATRRSRRGDGEREPAMSRSGGPADGGAAARGGRGGAAATTWGNGGSAELTADLGGARLREDKGVLPRPRSEASATMTLPARRGGLPAAIAAGAHGGLPGATVVRARAGVLVPAGPGPAGPGRRAARSATAVPRPRVGLVLPALPAFFRERVKARPAAALEWQDARLPLLGRIWATAWLPSILLAGCLVALMYLLQTSGVATTGYDIQRLQSERDDWQLRNEQLRLELAKRQSLTWIEAEAAGRLGMVRAEPTALTYLKVAR